MQRHAVTNTREMLAPHMQEGLAAVLLLGLLPPSRLRVFVLRLLADDRAALRRVVRELVSAAVLQVPPW